jgi:hypothetical protein
MKNRFAGDEGDREREDGRAERSDPAQREREKRA